MISTKNNTAVLDATAATSAKLATTASIESAGFLQNTTLQAGIATTAASNAQLSALASLENAQTSAQAAATASTASINAVNAANTAESLITQISTFTSINGVLLSSLSTGILKNTTDTGKPSIAVASDFPTLNQSTTGNAATATAIVGGVAGSILYQTSTGATGMLPPNTDGFVLTQSGGLPTWAASAGGSDGALTSSVDASINGITVGLGGGSELTNTVLGYNALVNNISGQYNTAIGFSALENNINGYDNTAVGTNALLNNTNGYNNTAVGSGALSINTGADNTAIGYNALRSNTTGGDNTAIGSGALINNDIGRFNIAIGSGALYLNHIGNANVAIGYGALQYDSTGMYNTALGHEAGNTNNFNTTGTYNTWLGYGTGSSDGTLTNSTALGNGSTITYSNQIVLGNTAVTSVTTTGVITASSYIGDSAGLTGTASSLSIGGNAATATAIVGGVAGSILYQESTDVTSLLAPTTNGYVLTLSGGLPTWAASAGGSGSSALTSSVDASIHGITVGLGGGSVNNNTAVGTNALLNNYNGYDNTAIGYNTLENNLFGMCNTAIGSNALYLNFNGEYNTAVGNSALFHNTSGSDNTAIGSNALTGNTNGGDNTAIGYNTLLYNTTGGDNIAVGSNALVNNVNGYCNTALGVTALENNINGSYSTAVGYQALFSSSGGNNTALGNSAAYTGVANTSGTYNTWLGNGTGSTDGTLTNSTALGNGAMITENNQIVLGNTAVTSVTTTGVITASSYIGDSTGLTGTASNLTVGNAAKATAIVGGVAGALPYQTSAGVTGMLAPTTNGYVLTLSGGLPIWAAGSSGANAGTLAGSSLNTTVINSSLTSVGTITSGTWNGTAITNTYLANSAVTVGSTSISLGASTTMLAGLSSVTSTTFVGTLTGHASLDLPLSGGMMNGTISFASGNITGLSAPFNSSDAATKAYVDAAINGFSWKNAVACATTANITLSGEQTIDGVLTSSSLVLVKNQTTATQNGIYISGPGTWTRAADSATGAELLGMAVYVQSGGTVNGGTGWTNSNTSAITLGTTGITFAQFGAGAIYTNGTGIGLSGNVFSNTGVISLAGTANQISVSNSNGAVILSLPLNLSNLSSVTATTFTGALIGNADTATTAGSVTTAYQPAITSVGSLLTLTTLGDATIHGITVGLGGGSLFNFNTAVGFSALLRNTNGSGNTAIGYYALQSNLYGQYNTALGSSTLMNNTSGGNNIAVGYNALENNTSGGDNIAIGYNALQVNIMGGSNTAIGSNALLNSNGSYNTALGYSAGDSGISNTYGNFNTWLGYGTGSAIGYLTNSTAIGNGAIISYSNQVVLGNSSVTQCLINGSAALTAPNDTSAAIPTISSGATIWPTTPIVFVSGTAEIINISPPLNNRFSAQITIIPTGAFTTTTGGNIALASTAVVNRTMTFTYSAATLMWYPSY